MKKSTSNKIAVTKNLYAGTFFYLLICGSLLTLMACKKSEQADAGSIPAPELNAQENTLIGKWALKKSETYEIAGVDSTGQYVCTLIGSSVCNSVCNIQFKNQYCWPIHNQELKGVGILGDCNPTAVFSWKATQPNKLETGIGNFYDIVYLSNDSVAFSDIYVKDILTLKTIMFYKKY